MKSLIGGCGVLLAVVGMTIAQPKVGLTPAGGAGALPPDDLAAPPQGKPAEPDDLTIEQLVDAVDKFRAQKAEIEKKEKAYMKALQKKADKLKQKIDSLNGVPEAPPVISTTGPVITPGPGAPPGVVPLPSAPGVPPSP